jgi:uronate dehydrogenase
VECRPDAGFDHWAMSRDSVPAVLADQTWVLTGAAGRIGTSVRPSIAQQVGRLRLVDRVPVTPEYGCEESFVADLHDRSATNEAIAGADGVVHLGGISDEAPFDDLCAVNILGTFNVVEAARLAGVARFVYASSNRVTGFYPAGTVVGPDVPTRPDSLYAVSKVAGEALGSVYADKFGLSFVSVRIASFEDAPLDRRHLSTWLSPRDCASALLAAMRATGVRYAAFYAVSANTRGWWDLTPGHQLGFHPVDNAEDYADAIEPGSALPADYPQGGVNASPERTLPYL